MSLTSYRAAPSRGTKGLGSGFRGERNAPPGREAAVPYRRGSQGRGSDRRRLRPTNRVNGFPDEAQAAMLGGDLLFHRLSDSTIGAVWFHGRVRDGIGWVTDAIATKQ